MGFFDSILDPATASIDSVAFAECLAAALVIGAAIALVYRYGGRHSQSLMFTIAMIPAVVTVIIMVVNGNIGAGIAVMGAFSLVRFRSAPGTAKEIGMIFLAMSTGLLTGMGFVGYAAVFTAVMCAICLVYTRVSGGWSPDRGMVLRITVPEDLDFDGAFDDVLSRYTSSHELSTVKTVNMGSMYRLTYDVTLRPDCSRKAMLDELRSRNGNLEIVLGHSEPRYTELRSWRTRACSRDGR